MTLGVWIVAVGVVAIGTLLRSFRVVGQHQRGIRTRLGRYHSTAEPGIVFLAPLVDDLILVDMRERIITAEEKFITSGAPARARAEVKFRILDPVKATFEARDLDGAIVILAGQALRASQAAGALHDSRDEPKAASAIRREVETFADRCGCEVTGVQVRLEPDAVETQK